VPKAVAAERARARRAGFVVARMEDPSLERARGLVMESAAALVHNARVAPRILEYPFRGGMAWRRTRLEPWTAKRQGPWRFSIIP